MKNKDITKAIDEQIKEERLKATAAGTGKKARAARHALKTKNKKRNTCPQGHKYTPENTITNAAGRRVCLECYKHKRIYPDKLADRQNRPGREIINLNEYNKENKNHE